MSPKSRLYTLVKAWKNKPFQEVRDACGQPWLGLSSEALEEHQSWSQRQAISNEPIFNSQGTKLTSSLFTPLLTATETQLLRLFMEGLDTITYWYRSGRFIQGILPLPAKYLASSKFIDALSDLILNSRLPVGLVSLGVQKLNEADSINSCNEGLLRMRRLGVLIHLLHFSGSSLQIRWIEEIEPEGIHIEIGQFRTKGLPNEMMSLDQKFYAQIYASNVTLVKDLENVMAIGAQHCYGGLMMPPISRHQMLHTSDSRIAKAIFSLHPHKNQNGDK
ncbi:diguanylate phosphodiesterase [Polynucleobacter sp. UK-Mo-2m-Kol15]|uniref:diguanylate phosphodiesterase n=1 Tax=Polynucleobacter sp. UK-Mo-2m-Kol15 TaxID=2576916 RepID=UPI001C0C1F0A|nr:diguanylate phosphodiesterase [Polynucleobacter sp. UK-Mo-2m-Kol15]MBU3576350.1 diguanylate phosphodiesterase [Polynucleobacter sp. UK-Mo-2m-Kol15]